MSALKIVNMHEAKTHLSRLVEGAVNGEPFIIARAGKPLVQVTTLETPERKLPIRFGFLKGRIEVPDDIDTMFVDDIEAMFYGDE